MLDWFRRYVAAVGEIYDQAKAHDYQIHEKGGFFAELRAVATDSVIVYFAPIPPVARAIRSKLLGV